MKRRRYLKRKNKEELDVELNIAPIIDCFMVVVTFLLVSASYISIGVIDTSSSEAVAAPSEPQPPALDITITLKTNRAIQLEVAGPKKETLELSSSASAFDYVTLDGKLKQLKKEFPGTSSATLNADAGVPYKEVVHAMEKTRDTLSEVFLDPEATR